MATDELMNLFTLEGEAPAKEGAADREPKAKRTRVDKVCVS